MRLVLAFLCAASVLAHGQNKVVKVTTIQQFANAIAPNTTIEMASGEYDIAKLDTTKSSPYYYLINEYDGKEFRIRNVSHLKIVGKGATMPHLLTRPRYGDVIQFEKCSDVTIEFVNAGHGTEAKGYCSGAVLDFEGCSNISIINSKLYGSGIYGIVADSLMKLTCRNTEISGCTYGILSISRGRDFLFDNCQLVDNEGFDMMILSHIQGLTFNKCTVARNKAMWPGTDMRYILFGLSHSSPVVIQDCTISGNACSRLFCWVVDDQGHCGSLPKDSPDMKLVNCKIEGNDAKMTGME